MPIHRLGQIAALALCLAATLSLSAQEQKGEDAAGPHKDSQSVGFIASKNANAGELGLPFYPGSRPHQDKADDSPSLQLGLWGRTWGFKLVVVKLESKDAPQEIAAFYQKALAKYGKVWDCTDATKGPSTQERADSPDGPDCKAEHPEAGETLLEAGPKDNRHIVGIKTEGGLSILQLVYVQAPPSDDKK